MIGTSLWYVFPSKERAIDPWFKEAGRILSNWLRNAKKHKKTLRLAYGQCSSKLYLAVVLSPWVHEAHAEDRQGLCPDEIGRVQSIWFVDSICADLWWLSVHTYCPTKEKQQKQVKQKLGTLKTRVVRINVARATLMMQWCYPLELRIMMGDHPLHMVSPHVEYQPGFP